MMGELGIQRTQLECMHGFGLHRGGSELLPGKSRCESHGFRARGEGENELLEFSERSRRPICAMGSFDGGMAGPRKLQLWGDGFGWGIRVDDGGGVARVAPTCATTARAQKPQVMVRPNER